jgi:hypothetical protein
LLPGPLTCKLTVPPSGTGLIRAVTVTVEPAPGAEEECRCQGGVEEHRPIPAARHRGGRTGIEGLREADRGVRATGAQHRRRQDRDAGHGSPLFWMIALDFSRRSAGVGVVPDPVNERLPLRDQRLAPYDYMPCRRTG